MKNIYFRFVFGLLIILITSACSKNDEIFIAKTTLSSTTINGQAWNPSYTSTDVHTDTIWLFNGVQEYKYEQDQQKFSERKSINVSAKVKQVGTYEVKNYYESYSQPKENEVTASFYSSVTNETKGRDVSSMFFGATSGTLKVTRIDKQVIEGSITFRAKNRYPLSGQDSEINVGEISFRVQRSR